MKCIVVLILLISSNVYACGGVKNTYFLNGFSSPVTFSYDGQKIVIGESTYIKKGENVYETISGKTYRLKFLISRGIDCSPREGEKIEVPNSEIE
jgi:hypothetical protein